MEKYLNRLDKEKEATVPPQVATVIPKVETVTSLTAQQ